jgi:(1->4)-alpha-D-glucan 1-alpha-D-glucosylmutase
MAAMRAPISTYRVQFNPAFGFEHARGIAGYLARLGVSDLYASPVFRARPGSTHGYDVTDPGQLNPELGGQSAFDALSAALQERSLGLLIDIVPNHMAAHADNRWWWDVLLKGRDSPHAPWFDIDWDRGGGKIILPILGSPLAEALERGEISIDAEVDPPQLRYFEHRLPLVAAPKDERVDVKAVLGSQHYELIHWREGPERINYRRFFDISDLIGVRPEVKEQFDAGHKKIVALARDGAVSGVRVDHIDGLSAPEEYLANLYEALSRGEGQPYILVEKILAMDEENPFGSSTAGTTGYDAMNLLNAVFVDEQGSKTLFEDARRRLDLPSFDDEIVACKRLAIERLFPGTLRALAALAAEALQEDPERVSLALAALTASLGVYRTYFEGERVREEDLEVLRSAEDDAADRNPDLADDIGALVDLISGTEQQHSEFVRRWQQFTGPVMAKGVEDTAMYRHIVLTSLNEVGGHPGPVSGAVERLHEKTAGIRRFGRTRMIATSTHDTKRSEDVRARISVLSEVPDLWIPVLDRWTKRDSAVSLRDQVLLMQSVIGAWPLNDAADRAFVDRIAAYMVKAAREAKLSTNWTDPNTSYERGLADAAAQIVKGFAGAQDIRAVQEMVDFYGALNSLSQTLLKLTMTGVPDIYQGAELWDLSLVDPDNRRPVDFAARERSLADLERGVTDGREPLYAELLRGWRDGRIKQYLTWTLLQSRRADRKLFLEGTYLPLPASGDHHRHVIAFERRYPDRSFIAIATRLLTPIVLKRELPADPEPWNSTFLELPASAPRTWRDLFSGRVLTAGSFGIKLSEAFALAPFAALEPA